MAWSAKAYFAGRFVPAKQGQHKWWFLVGGKSPSPKLQSIDVDGCPTRAVRVRQRWKSQLEEARDPVLAYTLLTQHLSDTLVWEVFFATWEAHKKAENTKDFNRNRSQKRHVSYANPFRGPSVRSCAARSIT